FAVPGLAGFAVTFALKLDVEQKTPVVPPDVSVRLAFVPEARLALRTSPTLTLVPPTLLTVSTSTVAADAAIADSATIDTVNAAVPRSRYLRMRFAPSSVPLRRTFGYLPVTRSSSVITMACRGSGECRGNLSRPAAHSALSADPDGCRTTRRSR